MLPPLRHKGRSSFLVSLCSLMIAASSAFAAADGVSLDQTSMTQAVRYLSVLSGREVSAEDAAWLKQQWADEHKASPKAVANQVDELAINFERHQQAENPLLLAESRTNLIKNAYCAAAQTSDPVRHRLRDILAFDGLVVAADCVLGLVVTRFDVKGLAASHALTAAATGQRHDVENDKAEILAAIQNEFADVTPGEKALLANGELRHAVLARFWSRIDGAPEQRAVVDEIRSEAAADVRGPARKLENLALSRLAAVDYLAKVGDARLTSGVINAYGQWLERVAGASFSRREQAWLQQTIIDDFRRDPREALNEVAAIRDLDKAYRRAESADDKNALVASWAADLFCYLRNATDPDEKRLAEMVYRHDPVIEADCQAGRITRKRDAALAESNGQRLSEHDLDVSFRFMRMILGRPLLPEEETVVRNDDTQSFKRDPGAWREQNEQYRAFLQKIENRGDNAFLRMDERKKLFDPIYCALRESDDAFADDYLKMFQRGDAIAFEDCSRQLVTTKDEIDALVRFVNFLTLLNGRPPLSQVEVEEVRQSLKSENLDDAESSMIAVNEWWSLLTLEEKAAEVQNVREKGVTPEAGGDTVRGFVQLAKLQVVLKNAQLQQCKMMAIIAEGNANIFAAKQGRSHLDDDGDLAGFPGEEYATLVSTNAMFAELCSQPLGG